MGRSQTAPLETEAAVSLREMASSVVALVELETTKIGTEEETEREARV